MRNVSDFESLWYEISPYAYLLIGAIVLFEAYSVAAVLSSLLLMIVAIIILRMRWTHRSSGKAKRARPFHRTPHHIQPPKTTLRHNKH